MMLAGSSAGSSEDTKVHEGICILLTVHVCPKHSVCSPVMLFRVYSLQEVTAGGTIKHRPEI